MTRASPARHRVVIIGGGFGGLPATRYLSRKDVDVTVIDRRNHHLFQPLLYQVATGMLPAGQISPPIRHVVRKKKNVRVELAEVTDIDLDHRLVHALVLGHERREFPYDNLIVATGAGQSYFGHDEFALYAPGMKTIDDALELRRRIFGAFEMAEMTDDPDEKKLWLTFAVVGAGPTGVELAGQIRDLAVRALRGEFRTFEASSARVILLDGGKQPLATFGQQLAGKAAKELQHVGVELRMGARVVGVDPYGVDLQDEAGNASRLDARVVIWAAGVQGVTPRRRPRSGHRRHRRPLRAGRGPARPEPARPSRGVRRRRHGVDQPPPRRGRGRHAGRPARRQHHPPADQGGGAPSVQVPGPRQRGHHRAVQGHRERPRGSSFRFPGLGRVGLRPPGFPYRVRQPVDHDNEMDPFQPRPGPARARVQRSPHRRRSEYARGGSRRYPAEPAAGFHPG
jgi:NADH dehydrogenase FAD-containing subunit